MGSLSSIYVGFDPREAAAFAVARSSVQRHLSKPIPIRGLVLADLQAAGLYSRPLEHRASAADRPIMWDTISDAPMSTQHANARFLVPHLARLGARRPFKVLAEKGSRHTQGRAGWALFMDGDMLVRADLARLELDPKFAVYCVKHRHEPPAGAKMDGQQQTQYARKNWSSFIAFNCEHPANDALTLEMVNSLPGRDLHRLCWLDDDEIGELGPEWNFLVGHSNGGVEPKVIHFTSGCPDMAGYEHVAYADDWRQALNAWALG